MKKNKKETDVKETKTEQIVLPQCGLAEDILGKAAPGAKPTEGPKNEDHLKPGSAPVTKTEILEKYVTFCLGKEEYALPITRVQEINRVVEITQVPNSPEHILGVINLRGRIIPVIDLRRRLKMAKPEITKQSRIIVVEQGPKILGLMVDSVSQVLNISSGQIEPPPEEVIENRDNYIQGVGKLEDRMIILLELNKVVNEGYGSGQTESKKQAY